MKRKRKDAFYWFWAGVEFEKEVQRTINRLFKKG